MPAAANAAGSAAPGIAPAATLSVTHAEITMPTAATKSGREVRDATNPPSSIPPAEPTMYAATALDARVAATPNCSFIAATPKLIRPVSAYAAVQDRQIGRMEYAVAQAREGRAQQQQPGTVREAHSRCAEAHQGDAAEQHAAAAVAVDDEPREGLEQRRDGVEHRRHHAERRIRHAELLAHQRKERRQHELHEVAGRVAEGDERDDERIVAIHAFSLSRNAVTAESVFSG